MKWPQHPRIDPRPDLRYFRPRWRREYLSVDNRFVDMGSSPGPSAVDMLRMQRRHNLKNKIIPFCTKLTILSILVGLITIVALKIGWFYSLSGVITANQIASGVITANQIATILLTLGLLVAIWRYANLTASILSEMREARRYDIEPRVSVYTWGWLEAPTNPKAVIDYGTEVIINNVGKSPVLNPHFHFEYYSAEGPHSGGSVVHTPTDSTILSPGSEATASFSCSKKQIMSYLEIIGPGYYGTPFVTFRLVFRDSFSKLYSITQDYGLIGGNSDTPKLMLQCEFVSSPSGYGWRTQSN